MITIKNAYAQERMVIAGRLLAELFERLREWVRPGVSTQAIDGLIEKYLDDHKLRTTLKGYLGYRHVSCVSINDEVVHGVPRESQIAALGDLVKIDVCASYDGYCADMARAFYLGETPAEVEHFMLAAQKSLDAGIACARPGERLGTLSASIEKVIKDHGFGIVREFAGHGIGKKMHEDPEILNYGKAGTGPEIKAGMAFAIEPMLTMGDHRVYVLNDGWTVKTNDKSLAMHVEDTVLVTDNGPRVLTRL